MQSELFLDEAQPPGERESIGPEAFLLCGFAAAMAADAVREIQCVAARSPFRHMVTPGGQRMSVGMTNCGPRGWVSDRQGYRYAAADPLTGEAWPPMPAVLQRLAVDAAAEAGFANFGPDACLINRYEPGARMGLHQDKDEKDLAAPIVSVSLGLPAIFQFGGETRKQKPARFRLESGDVVVWGGRSRLSYHGVSPLADGEHPLTGRCRLNLTFRKTSSCFR